MKLCHAGADHSASWVTWKNEEYQLTSSLVFFPYNEHRNENPHPLWMRREVLF